MDNISCYSLNSDMLRKVICQSCEQWTWFYLFYFSFYFIFSFTLLDFILDLGKE